MRVFWLAHRKPRWQDLKCINSEKADDLNGAIYKMRNTECTANRNTAPKIIWTKRKQIEKKNVPTFIDAGY